MRYRYFNQSQSRLAQTRQYFHVCLRGLLLGLLCLGMTAQAQQAPDSDWWSAIRRDDVSMIKTKVLRGADPTALNSLGNPALTQAVREQSWKVYDILRITPGVQIDQANAHDETALMYLCILGETGRAAELITAGAQVNRLGWTPLHYAASRAQVDTARMLIERGAIVNAPGPDGTTPLMMAALSGKQAIVQLLLDHGADPTMFNTGRETPADWARKRDHTALAAKLDEAAAKASQRRTGSTAPTHEAHAVEQAGAEAASKEDKSSFSRYFDPGRFNEDDN